MWFLRFFKIQPIREHKWQINNLVFRMKWKSHFCACPKLRPKFLKCHMFMWSFLCVKWFEVRGGYSFWYWWIIDHHCLNFLFMIYSVKIGFNWSSGLWEQDWNVKRYWLTDDDTDDKDKVMTVPHTDLWSM